MIQAVIFDMDGVIFDSETLVMKLWMKIGEEQHIPDIEKVVRECIGTTSNASKQIFQSHYGEDFDYESNRTEVSKRYIEYVRLKGVPMKLGIIELLKYLKAEGIKVGLASSTRKNRVEEQLDIAGLTSYFDVIVCGDMVAKSKPEPDIFLACAKQLEVAPEDAYVIEDSYNGIRAASCAKMHPIMVPDLLMPTDEMHALSEKVLHDLLEAKQYFERIEQL